MARRVVGLALGCLLSVVAACGGGGGGSSSGGGSVAPGAAGVTGPWGTQTNQSQWQTALAALASAPTPDPVRLEPAAIAAWNDLIRRSWPGLVPVLENGIQGALQSQVGQGSGIQLLGVRNLAIGFSAPPQVGASAPSPIQTFSLFLPQAPDTWSLSLTAIVGGNVPISIGGFSTQVPIHVDVTVDVRDIRIEQTMSLNLYDPLDIRFGPPGAPAIQLALSVSSQSPIVSTIASALTQLLDPIVRVGLVAATAIVQQELGGLLSALPQGPAWGLGGPGVQPNPGAPALQPLAEQISDEIQANHMPFGQVYPAIFDSPQGTQVVRYAHHGDSAIWTGHYLAGEAYRFDVTGDPRALAGATRAVGGLRLLLDVARTGDGLLSRAAIPASSPRSVDIQGSHVFTGTVNGVDYRAIGNISRDQYVGFMMGLGQTWLRVPALRADAAELIGRVVTYLERTGWIAQQPNFMDMSSPFLTAPAAVLAFTKLAAVTDPGRYQAIHGQYAPMADLIWFNAWVSAREVHEGYYKFNLVHGNLVSLLEVETDPARYRAYVRTIQTTRTTVGHHMNAWFDAIHGMANPALQPTVGPLVQDELDRWTLRPRRGFSIQNSQNPSVQTAVITITTPNSASGGPSTSITTQPRTKTVSVYPLPIEDRPSTDFVWQRTPFGLDGAEAPELQNTGVDLHLPYWFARSHGLIP